MGIENEIIPSDLIATPVDMGTAPDRERDVALEHLRVAYANLEICLNGFKKMNQIRHPRQLEKWQKEWLSDIKKRRDESLFNFLPFNTDLDTGHLLFTLRKLARVDMFYDKDIPICTKQQLINATLPEIKDKDGIGVKGFELTKCLRDMAIAEKSLKKEQ